MPVLEEIRWKDTRAEIKKEQAAEIAKVAAEKALREAREKRKKKELAR